MSSTIQLLNEHRLADIARLEAMISKGCYPFVQRNKATYMITDTDINRAKGTLENLSQEWTDKEWELVCKRG